MNQFESFETVNGTVVVVNKATITYIKPLTDGSSMIFFNSLAIIVKYRLSGSDAVLKRLRRFSTASEPLI